MLGTPFKEKNVVESNGYEIIHVIAYWYQTSSNVAQRSAILDKTMHNYM